MNLIHVDGEDGIARDAVSGSILSTDPNAFKKWKDAQHKRKEIEETLIRVSSLESKLESIEAKLAAILEKL